MNGRKLRKLADDEKDSKQYNWTNSEYAKKKYGENDPTPFTVIDEYVEYEGSRYEYFDEIISDVRKRLEHLKKKYRPMPIPEKEEDTDTDIADAETEEFNEEDSEQ